MKKRSLVFAYELHNRVVLARISEGDRRHLLIDESGERIGDRLRATEVVIDRQYFQPAIEDASPLVDLPHGKLGAIEHFQRVGGPAVVPGQRHSDPDGRLNAAASGPARRVARSGKCLYRSDSQRKDTALSGNRQSQQPVVDRHSRQSGARPDFRLLENVLDVLGNGPRADRKPGGDGLVAEASGKHRQKIELSQRQAEGGLDPLHFGHDPRRRQTITIGPQAYCEPPGRVAG